jgi:hypothetical protein
LAGPLADPLDQLVIRRGVRGSPVRGPVRQDLIDRGQDTCSDRWFPRHRSDDWDPGGVATLLEVDPADPTPGPNGSALAVAERAPDPLPAVVLVDRDEPVDDDADDDKPSDRDSEDDDDGNDTDPKGKKAKKAA